MATFLIFDFGENEDAAQQARHRVDGWRQGFRLDKKLQLKFDRSEANGGPKKKAAEKGESKPDQAATPSVRLIVRLDFSDHEKLSHQRWIERIPSDDLFKSAKAKIVPPNDPQFKVTAEHFAELN